MELKVCATQAGFDWPIFDFEISWKQPNEAKLEAKRKITVKKRNKREDIKSKGLWIGMRCWHVHSCGASMPWTYFVLLRSMCYVRDLQLSNLGLPISAPSLMAEYFKWFVTLLALSHAQKALNKCSELLTKTTCFKRKQNKTLRM